MGWTQKIMFRSSVTLVWYSSAYLCLAALLERWGWSPATRCWQQCMALRRRARFGSALSGLAQRISARRSQPWLVVSDPSEPGCSWPGSADMPPGTVLLANVSAACVPVHQTGEAPGREPQACYMFSCSVMSEIGTAVPEPVSWGPQGVWDWVDLAKSLWGLNNSYKQKKGFLFGYL